ncbi:MAG: hypothetical protein KGI58_01630 [Patescibacteria group bacterium]|nr:hypothetical protein [Patescibacteria group bacterium]
MNKNNSNILMWVVIIIVAAGILFFVFRNKNAVAPVTENTNTTSTTDNTQTANKVESVQDTSQTTGIGAVSISYTNALAKYADRRIQLDNMCQASPNTVTYKDNTGIMIDNRSAETRTVKIGTNYTIKPYGFKIIVLPDVYLKSKTLLVDCDASQNVATILIQE